MRSLEKIKNKLQPIITLGTQKFFPTFRSVYNFNSLFSIETKTHRRVAIFSASLIFLVLLIQNPANVFAGNIKEFSLNTIDYFGRLFPAYIFGSLVLALPAVFIRGRVLAFYALLLGFIAILIWVYSNIIVINFGVLDGGKFDFSTVSRIRFRILETLLLASAFLGLFYLYIKYSKQASYLLATLNVIVAISVVIQLTTNFQSGRKFTTDDNDAIYRVSETKNVLIILMDQFQSDIFSDLVRNRPALKQELEGFTFFPDTLGVAPTTKLTMPSIHSGDFYETGPRLTRFYRTRVERGSFFNSLTDAGHEVVLVSPPALGCPRRVALCKAVWSAVFQRDELLASEIAKLLDFSFFRASPVFWKEGIYNNDDWIFSERQKASRHFVVTGNKFLTNLSSSMQVSGIKPATKFVHLMSTHRPYVVNEQCRFTGNNRSQSRRTQMYNQASCAMDKFIEVLQKLKSVGAYDNATIMLIADTGVGAFNVGSSHGIENGTAKYTGAGLYGAANPVFLIKPMNARGAYSISEKPVQLTDVPSTVCDLTGDCNGFPGQSVFGEIDHNRERKYNLYHLTTEWSDRKFVPTPLALSVKGPIWDLASWPDVLQPVMKPGAPIKFNYEEHNSVYLGEGWGPIRVEGTFTYAEEATMYFYPESDLADAYEFTVNAEDTFSTPGDGDDIVEVFANGQLIDSWVFSTPGRAVENKVIIPKELIASHDLLEIRFKLKSPNSWVVERGNVRHVRTRGFRLLSTRFDPVNG